MVLKKIADKIVLSVNEKEIESYKFDEEINFSKFFEYLLSLNMSNKIELINESEGLNESEENLVKIINSVVDDYNKKVEELSEFKEKIEEESIDTL